MSFEFLNLSFKNKLNFSPYSRDQPLDNLKDHSDADEEWYDCESQSPVNLKDSHKTPPHRSSQSFQCPPAPCRRSFLNDSSGDECKSDESFEEGILPLDGSSLRALKTEKTVRSPNSKRARKEEDGKKSKIISLEESRYSELQYFEVTGVVSIRHHTSTSSRDECDRRECKMQISYRVHKDKANDVQIALIVYKNNSNNFKSRRNLMSEFKDEAETSSVQIESLSTRELSVKEKSISSTPQSKTEKTKPMKRSSSSRNCLRF